MKSSYKPISDIVERVDIRNSDGNADILMGLSIDKCFIRSVANTVGTDLKKYKVIRRNQFAVSLMQVSRDSKIPVACFRECDRAIMSPAYSIFQVADESVVLPDYLDMWFKRAEFDREAAFIAVGGVRGSMPWEEFARIKVRVPTIDEQRSIVKAYQTITERIELKRRINDNLEAQVNAFYKKLTQENEPNDIFSSICSVESGKRPVSSNAGDFPLLGAGGIMSYIDNYNFDEPILVTGRVGTHGVIQKIHTKCWASDNTLVIKSRFYEFAYHFLKSVDWSLLNRGSTQPLVTQTDIKNLPIYLPTESELTEFEQMAEKYMALFDLHKAEIEKLIATQSNIVTSLSRN